MKISIETKFNIGDKVWVAWASPLENGSKVINTFEKVFATPPNRLEYEEVIISDINISFSDEDLSYYLAYGFNCGFNKEPVKNNYSRRFEGDLFETEKAARTALKNHIKNNKGEKNDE